MAIEKLNNEEIRSNFIKDLETLYQKYKYGSEEFYLKLVDLVMGNTSIC
jgi:archaellum component FlaD/FlaE